MSMAASLATVLHDNMMNSVETVLDEYAAGLASHVSGDREGQTDMTNAFQDVVLKAWYRDSRHENDI